MSHRAHYLLSPNLIDELTPISSLRSSDLLVSLTVISKFSGAHGGSASSTTYSPTESERSDPPHRAHGHGRPATTQEYGNVIEPTQEDHGPTSPPRPHSIDDAYPSTNGSVMSEGAEGASSSSHTTRPQERRQEGANLPPDATNELPTDAGELPTDARG